MPNDPVTRKQVINVMMQEVYNVNHDNGWFDADRRFGEDIALLHSEVSEALEEFRDNGTAPYVKIDGGFLLVENQNYNGHKPLGVPSEMADILVRLLDTCHRYNIDLAAEFDAKLAYNRTRGHRHGGKQL
jgi:hypothetical protein